MRLHPFSLLTGLIAGVRRFLGFIAITVVLSLLRAEDRGFGFDLVWFLGLPVGLGLVYQILIFATTRFELTATEAVLDTGLVWKRRRVVPRSRVQEVHLSQDLIQRALGIVVLKIESAATGQPEIVLDAIGKSDAEDLRNQLTGKAGARVYTRPELPLYELSTRRIILSALLENRALLMLAGVVGLLSPALENDVLRSRLTRIVFAGSKTLAPVQIAIIVAVAVVAGWAFSVGIGLWAFSGFRIERHARGIQVSQGLVNLSARVMSAHRINELTIVQGLLYRLAGLHSMKARTSGVDIEEKATTGLGYLSPAATRAEVPVLAETVFPGVEVTAGQGWQRIHPAGPFLRILSELIVAAIALAVIVTALNVVLRITDTPESQRVIRLVLNYTPLAVGGVLGLIVLSQLLRTLAERYVLQGGYLVWRRTGLTSMLRAVPLARLQAMAVDQTPLQRMFKVCSVDVLLPGVVLPIKDIGSAQAETLLQDGCAFRATTQRRTAS